MVIEYLKVRKIVKDTNIECRISRYSRKCICIYLFNEKVRPKTVGFVFSKFSRILTFVSRDTFQHRTRNFRVLAHFYPLVISLPRLGKSHYRWVLVWPRKRSSRVLLSNGGIGLSSNEQSRIALPETCQWNRSKIQVPCSSVATVTRGFVVFRFEELEVERQSREMATSLSFSFFFFYYYQGNVPVWRGMKVPRVRFLDEKVANASLPSIDLRFFFLPRWNGHCSDSKLFLVEV